MLRTVRGPMPMRPPTTHIVVVSTCICTTTMCQHNRAQSQSAAHPVRRNSNRWHRSAAVTSREPTLGCVHWRPRHEVPADMVAAHTHAQLCWHGMWRARVDGIGGVVDAAAANDAAESIPRRAQRPTTTSRRRICVLGGAPRTHAHTCVGSKGAACGGSTVPGTVLSPPMQ